MEIIHGDITTDKNISPGNIVSKIGDLLKKYAASTHYKASDFQLVIHIIDMDGAYIPDDAIVYDETHETPYYSETVLPYFLANFPGFLDFPALKHYNSLICADGLST
ncbi:MAG: hypothetical protein LUH00_12175 [Lachnospiraceae bacterium]|nr:hypothetical protein [Lachnospiraceae bacterium]